MIGARVGIVCGPRVGVAVGAGEDPIGGSSTDAAILIWGQSHAEGPVDAYGAGSGNFTGGDGKGMQYNVAFDAVRYRQTSSDAPSSPMSWLDFGTLGLQTYRAAGQANTGCANALGRFLIRHGFYGRVGLAVCGIGSTSVPGNWLPSSNYPASGEKVYAHFRDFGIARQAEFGRKFGAIFHQIGESDAGTQARIDSCVADYNAMYTALLADWGIDKSAVHIFITLINPATSGNTTLNNLMRIQQAAWVDQWVAGGGRASCASTDGFWMPLESGTHYLPWGFNALGGLFGLAYRDQFFPGRNLNLGSGPYPYYQGGEMGYSAQATPNTSRPLGYIDPQVGDVEVLQAHGNGNAHTVTLVSGHDAGFTSVIAQTDSVSGASHRSITIWMRVITQAMLDARPAFTDGIKRGPCETPQIDFGVATLNFSTIHCFRGCDTVSPIGATATGANNAGTTSVTIGGFTPAKDNSLIVIMTCTNQIAGQITAVTNAGLTNIHVPAQFPDGRDSQVNPGTGTINMAMTTARRATASAVGTTTVTFGASSLNIAAIVALSPP